MKEIKILNLKLRNFKGMKDFELNLEGKDVNIYGDNGIGKTSIMDAFIWLLFDKDSQNNSNFKIKTLDKEGNAIHGLEHEVSAKLKINGTETELQKIYKEKWTKKSGQTETELSGHTTDYFINGVPKKKKEYTEYLANIIDEDTFKILTNPLFYNLNLKWQDRREIALKLCEEIKQSEVMSHDSKLKELEQPLKDKTVDDLKTEMIYRRKKLNEELKSIPYRIDELSRENIEVDIEALNKEKEVLEEKLNKLKNSKAVNYEFQLRSITGTISMLKNEIKDLKRNLTEEIRVNLDNANKAKYNLEKAVHEGDSKALQLSSNATGLVDLIEKTEKEMEDLREEFKDTRVVEFDKGSTICPTCQQSLPAEEIERLIKEFEENKANKLREINETGKQKKRRLEKATKELIEAEKELAEIKAEIETTNLMLKGKKKEIAEYEKEIESIENIDVTSLKEYKENKMQIEKLEKEKLDIEKIAKEEDHTELIQKLESRILEINKDLVKFDLAEQNAIRVNELLKRERELAQQVADTEKVEFLCDEYIITKSNLLENDLNSKFKLVKFKLFDLQINGGINETFVTTVNGVPFEDLNSAMKINAGLDIITTLSKHYGFKAPIFLDNRESVNQIPDMNAQVINLIVSKHKSLRVEVQE